MDAIFDRVRQTSSTQADPANNQWMRKKRRSPSWERRAKGIVYDRRSNSIEVRREADVEKAGYISCNLPSHRNTVSVFLNSNESKAFVGNGSRKSGRSPGQEEVFIGVLDLDMLPIRDKISRLCGNLKTLYVAKAPENDDWTDPV